METNIELKNVSLEALTQKIRVVDQRLREHYDAVFQDLDLTGTQALLLHYISHSVPNPVYAKDIGKAFCIRPASACRLIHALEKKGFIKKENNSSDDRLKRLVLAPLTLQIEDILDRRIAAANDWLNGLLSEEEKVLFDNLLSKLM